MLERLTRQRFADWVLPCVICALLLGLYLAGPELTLLLRYDRSRVLSGEGWRLLTAHLVHGDAPHLAWNLVGVLLVWFLFAREYTMRGWLLVLALSTIAIDLGFLLLQRELDWYVGFSGVLHGCMAAGLVAWLRSARDPLTVVVAALFAAKLAWEHFMGALPFTAASLTLPVIHEAHSYGAVGGLVAGLLLNRRRPDTAPSL